MRVRSLVMLAATLCCSLVAVTASAQQPSSKSTAPMAEPPPELGGPVVADETPTTGADVGAATAEQKAEATKAYTEGMTALDDKRFAEALAAFRRSYGVVASPNSRLLVARALVELGRLADAYRELELTVAEAQTAAAADPKYEATAEAAKLEQATLKAQIGFVTVAVVGAAPTAMLTLGGRTIDGGDWGKPVAVDPGSIEVVLTEDAGRRQTVEVAAGASVEVRFEPVQAPPPPIEEPTSGWDGPDRKMMAYIAGGVGLVGIGTFGIFGTLAEGHFERLDTGCKDASNCDPSLQFLADEGQTYQTVANVTLAIGLIGIGAGAGLYLWDFFDSGNNSELSAMRPRLTVGPGSVVVSGRF